MTDTYKLKMEIREEPDNIWANYDQLRVYWAADGLFANLVYLTDLTVVQDQVDYEHDHVGGNDNAAAWYTFRNSGSGNETDYSAMMQYGTSSHWYVTIADMRAEGVTAAMVADARMADLILEAQQWFDRMTGRYFTPRTKTIRRSADQGPTLRFSDPIVKLTSVKILWGGPGVNRHEFPVDLDGLAIYNRHLTEGTINPDDRDNPRIQFVWPTYGDVVLDQFGAGRQNVEMEGIFGYTELMPDDQVGETTAGSQVPLCYGSTPLPVQRACKKLVLQNIPLEIRRDLKERAERGTGRIQEVRTKDQAMKFFSPVEVRMPLGPTGDPVIDRAVAFYTAHGFGMAAV